MNKFNVIFLLALIAYSQSSSTLLRRHLTKENRTKEGFHFGDQTCADDEYKELTDCTCTTCESCDENYTCPADKICEKKEACCCANLSWVDAATNE
jgi:hypothetical protein